MIEDLKTKEFLQLFSHNQRRIYAYIRAQVRNPSDADDVFQEVSAVLWRKFGEFQPGTEFARWACRVARLEILSDYRHRRRLIPVFSQTLQEMLADELVELVDSVDARHEALAGCLEQLTERNRALIECRYRSDETIGQIAQNIGRTESAVYKTLSRIHDMLLQCIERSLGEREVGV